MYAPDPRQMSTRLVLRKFEDACSQIKGGQNKLAVILGEYARRKLWDERKNSGVIEAVKKSASISEKKVSNMLRVERNLQPFEKLLKLFYSGAQGWTKFQVILPVLNKKNENFFHRTIQSTSKRNLETIVRDIKKQREMKEDQSKATRGNQPVSPQFLSSGDTAETSALPMLFDTASPTKAPLPPTTEAKKLTFAHRASTEDDSVLVKRGKSSTCPCCNYSLDESPVNRDGEKRIYRNVRLTCRVAEKLLDVLDETRKNRETKVNLSVLLEEILNTYIHSDEKLRKNKGQYIEVFDYDKITGKRTVKTRFGPVEVTEEERQNLEPVYKKPISVVKVLEEAKVIAKEYDKKRRREGRGPTRYIPKKIKFALWLRAYGGYCEKLGCYCRAIIYHHYLRYALNPCHDPDYFGLFCYPHHDLIHQGFIANEGSMRFDMFTIGDDPEEDELIKLPLGVGYIDSLYKQYQQRAA